MNLILTQGCNKHCSFCFAYEKSKVDMMTIDFVEKIVKSFPETEGYKILGGEPTLNKDFIEITKVLYENGKSSTFCTNALFPNVTLESIVDNKEIFDIFLINGMELNEHNIGVFSKNYNTIKENFESVTMSLVITEKYRIPYYKEYIRFLNNNGVKCNRLRLSLDLCGTYIIQDTDIGDTIKYIVENFIEEGNQISFDCMTPPCVFDYDLIDFFGRYKTNDLVSSCGIGPLDIYPDGSCVFCFPTQKIARIDNVFDYKSRDDIYKELANQLQDYSSTVSVDDRCINCGYYILKRCNSLCEGCYQK